MYLFVMLFTISSVNSNDVDCGLLEFGWPWAPYTGSIEYMNTSNPFRTGSVAKLRCARGYTLKGPEITKCSPLSKWTDVSETPSCHENICQNPESFVVENGHVYGLRDENTGTYLYGTAYAVVCHENYLIYPEDALFRVCLDRGVWSGNIPKCVSKNLTSDTQPTGLSIESCSYNYIYYIIGAGIVYFVVSISNAILVCFLRTRDTKTIEISSNASQDTSSKCSKIILPIIIILVHCVLPFSIMLSLCGCGPIRRYLRFRYADKSEDILQPLRYNGQSGDAQSLSHGQRDSEDTCVGNFTNANQNDQQEGNSTNIQDLENQVEHWRNQASIKDDTIADILNTLEQKKEKIKELKEKISDQEIKASKAAQSSECGRAECIRMQVGIEYKNDEIEKYKKEINELKDKIGTMLSRLDEYKDNFHEIEKTLSSKLASADTDKTHLNNRIMELCDHIKELQQQGSELGGKLVDAMPNEESRGKTVRFLSSFGHITAGDNTLDVDAIIREAQTANLRNGDESSSLDNDSNITNAANNLPTGDQSNIVSANSSSSTNTDNASILAELAQGNVPGTEETRNGEGLDLTRFTTSLPARVPATKKKK